VFRQQTVSIRLTNLTTDFSVDKLLYKLGDNTFLTHLRRAMTDKSPRWEHAGPVDLIAGYTRAK
jgi:hypothetical protein